MKQKSNKNNNQLEQSAGPDHSRRIIDNQFVMPSTSVENVLQISFFMQNKPNVKIGKVNLSIAIIMDYEEINPNEAKAANNQSSLITNHLEGKPNQTQFKPNSNPIPERPKMNLNIYHTIGYSNKTAPSSKINKPNQTQFKANLETAHISDIYQRNSLSHLFRRPIITDECYAHNEDFILRK